GRAAYRPRAGPGIRPSPKVTRAVQCTGRLLCRPAPACTDPPAEYRMRPGSPSRRAGSAHVRPGLTVDGRAGGHVADAEFGGQLAVRQPVCPAGSQLPAPHAGQLGPPVTLADRAVIVAVAFAAPGLESNPDVVA